ncbi:MAG: hypothetical protein NC121_09645 [Blautia sp.]|nr:hypothetical protein [Blautia sp.]
MIYTERDKNTEYFIPYIEQAVSKLAVQDYSAFLDMFDSSRLSEEDMISALKFLDDDWPVTRIDDPLITKCEKRRIDIFQYNDGSGYHIDYDLSTDGERNDLTLSCEFLKTADGYYVSVLDLHTL